jgi:hypothetical protein
MPFSIPQVLKGLSLRAEQPFVAHLLLALEMGFVAIRNLSKITQADLDHYDYKTKKEPMAEVDALSSMNKHPQDSCYTIYIHPAHDRAFATNQAIHEFVHIMRFATNEAAMNWHRGNDDLDKTTMEEEQLAFYATKATSKSAATRALASEWSWAQVIERKYVDDPHEAAKFRLSSDELAGRLSFLASAPLVCRIDKGPSAAHRMLSHENEEEKSDSLVPRQERRSAKASPRPPAMVEEIARARRGKRKAEGENPISQRRSQRRRREVESVLF